MILSHHPRRSIQHAHSHSGIASISLESAIASPLSATLINLPASVANKQLTAKLNPLDATLTKNRGGWGGLWLTRRPTKGGCPDRPEAVEGRRFHRSPITSHPSPVTRPFRLPLLHGSLDTDHWPRVTIGR